MTGGGRIVSFYTEIIIELFINLVQGYLRIEYILVITSACHKMYEMYGITVYFCSLHHFGSLLVWSMLLFLSGCEVGLLRSVVTIEGATKEIY